MKSECYDTIRMKKKRMRRIAGILIAVLVLGVAAGFQTKNFIKGQSRQNVEEEIASLHQKEDADGIVEETPNPYFIEKQAGYSYRSPQTITYYSGLTQTMRHAMVFLPADYDEKKSYPVLYLLHGYGGSHRTWRNKKADVLLQNLSYFEDVPEMIVVCPNSNVNEEELVGYLMPYINSNYPVMQDREHTAVAGNSMGGRNALAVAYRYPEHFGYVVRSDSSGGSQRYEYGIGTAA